MDCKTIDLTIKSPKIKLEKTEEIKTKEKAAKSEEKPTKTEEKARDNKMKDGLSESGVKVPKKRKIGRSYGLFCTKFSI